MGPPAGLQRWLKRASSLARQRGPERSALRSASSPFISIGLNMLHRLADTSDLVIQSSLLSTSRDWVGFEIRRERGNHLHRVTATAGLVTCDCDAKEMTKSLCKHGRLAVECCIHNNMTFGDNGEASSLLVGSFPPCFHAPQPLLPFIILPDAATADDLLVDRDERVFVPPRNKDPARKSGKRQWSKGEAGPVAVASSPRQHSHQTVNQSAATSMVAQRRQPTVPFVDAVIKSLGASGYFQPLSAALISHEAAESVVGPFLSGKHTRRALRCSQCGSEEHSMLHNCPLHLSRGQRCRDPGNIAPG